MVKEGVTRGGGGDSDSQCGQGSDNHIRITVVYNKITAVPVYMRITAVDNIQIDAMTRMG